MPPSFPQGQSSCLPRGEIHHGGPLRAGTKEVRASSGRSCYRPHCLARHPYPTQGARLPTWGLFTVLAKCQALPKGLMCIISFNPQN